MERAKLIVKNFGPLKSIEIEIRPMITLIGAQASGKSTLAKLISIFEDEQFRIDEKISFEEVLDNYNIHSYLNELTYIEYHSIDTPENLRFNFLFKYEDKKFIKQNPVNFASKLSLLKPEDRDRLSKKGFLEKFKAFIDTHIDYIITLDPDLKKLIEVLPLQFRRKRDVRTFILTNIKHNKLKDNHLDNIFELINKEHNIEEYLAFYEALILNYPNLYKHDSLYIPSERNLLHLIEGNTMGLIKNKIKIPLHILTIGTEYEKALRTVYKLPISIIDKNLDYSREGENSYIHHNKIGKTNLLESASGLQTVIPILLLVEYSKSIKNKENFNFIIEEPELNLYPKAQHNLTKYLIKNCLKANKNLVITTHSPFVLASLNNLLMAFHKGKIKPKEVNKIIKKESWLNPENFIAYELKSGRARKITDDKIGIIKENMIDNVSDFFSNEFDNLLDL